MVCGQYNSRELGFSIIHVVMLSFVLLLQILKKQRQRGKKRGNSANATCLFINIHVH